MQRGSDWTWTEHGSQSKRSTRRVSRRGLLAGMALTPLALEAARLSGAGVASEALAAPASDVAAQASPRIVHNTNPPLEESRLELLEGLITPIPNHFIRNHAAHAELDVNTWRLAVDGEVDRPMDLTYEQLRAMPSTSLNVLIECAGNSRGRYSPQAQGTQWGNGAVSVAEWTGVPLRAVLEMAGIRPSTVHVIAQGADSAKVTRGLPTDFAMRPDVLLAWAMNGETVPQAHGFPLRLVVPNWIGVSNVKWLQRITASPVPLEGQYQTVNYMYYPNDKPSYPATLLPVKSAIARPTANATVGGSVLISGFAWSGTGRIAQVEVSADGGSSWTPARLLEPNDPRAWVRWSLLWQAPGNGSYTLMSRATDGSGGVQPASVEWNRLGYGYNAIQGVPITVGGAAAMAPAEATGGSTAPEAPVSGGNAPVAASAGAAVYSQACARCHGDQGEGSVDSPRIIGPNTLPHASTREELFQYVKANMPYDNPGTLSDAEYQAAVDFLRQANGLP